MAPWLRNLLGLLLLAILGYSLFQASWLAAEPAGKAKLVAGKPVELPLGRDGCYPQQATQIAWGREYGRVSPVEIQILQATAGNEAEAIVVESEAKDEKLLAAREFTSECARDIQRPRIAFEDALKATQTVEQFVAVNDAAHAEMLAGLPAAGEAGRVFFAAREADLVPLKGKDSFSIEKARQCASDYRSSGLWGSVPENCAGGTMLLTLDELGLTLWGWPNRFLARMKDADVRVIVAAAVNEEGITGLTELPQYRDIADSYNGYIWIDNIGDLGPALRQ